MKKKTILFLFLLLIGSFLLFLPCDKDLYCEGRFANIVQYPFLWFGVLFVFSILSLFLEEKKYKFWSKFSGVFLGISLFIVYLMPEYDSNIFSVTRELTNWFFLGIYGVVSIIYFIVQFVKNRR